MKLGAAFIAGLAVGLVMLGFAGRGSDTTARKRRSARSGGRRSGDRPTSVARPTG